MEKLNKQQEQEQCICNLLSENIHIDTEIQNIIDEHFWDML